MSEMESYEILTEDEARKMFAVGLLVGIREVVDPTAAASELPTKQTDYLNGVAAGRAWAKKQLSGFKQDVTGAVIDGYSNEESHARLGRNVELHVGPRVAEGVLKTHTHAHADHSIIKSLVRGLQGFQFMGCEVITDHSRGSRAFWFVSDGKS